MRNRLNPWVVVLTAALTFGSLMAFIGPRHFGHHYWGYYGHYGRHGWYGPHDGYRHGDRGGSNHDRHAERVPAQPDTSTYQ